MSFHIVVSQDQLRLSSPHGPRGPRRHLRHPAPIATARLQELVFETTSAALAAGLERTDLDAVVIGAGDELDGRSISNMPTASAGALLKDEAVATRLTASADLRPPRAGAPGPGRQRRRHRGHGAARLSTAPRPRRPARRRRSRGGARLAAATGGRRPARCWLGPRHRLGGRRPRPGGGPPGAWPALEVATTAALGRAGVRRRLDHRLPGASRPRSSVNRQRDHADDAANR